MVVQVRKVNPSNRKAPLIRNFRIQLDERPIVWNEVLEHLEPYGSRFVKMLPQPPLQCVSPYRRVTFQGDVLRNRDRVNGLELEAMESTFRIYGRARRHEVKVGERPQ